MDEFMRTLLISSAEKNLPPLKQSIELVEGEKEIVPGISVVPAPGHTPGHLAVAITSGATQFLHMSDTVLHPLHLENPSWRPIFDLDAEGAAKSRQHLLDRAASDRIKVLAYHFAFPGLGRIESRGNSWRWLVD
jgi:glyoxylase-like metal-dependent hydrolase (beta-lactamase superfamily II)